MQTSLLHHAPNSISKKPPGVVARVQAQGPVLPVATAAAHAADALGTQLAGSGGATHLLGFNGFNPDPLRDLG